MSRNGSPPEFNPDAKDRHGAGRLRFTLALDLANPSEKRSRIASLSDLALNDLTSPRSDDREKAVLQTPTPTQFLFPKNVTEEQEAYANGFERALEEIYKEKGPPLALTVESDDPDTKDGRGSGRDMVNVSSVSSSPPRPSQDGVPVTSRGQFSQCVSQASFGNALVASNIANNNCNSVSTSSFNFVTNSMASRAACLPSQSHPSVCRNQQFAPDVKAPMSYAGVPLCRDPAVPFRSVMSGHVTASGATVNWPANRFANSCAKVLSSDGSAPLIQSQTGTIPQIPAQSGMVPRFHAQTGTVPSDYSYAGTVLHSHVGPVPGNNAQAGTTPLMHSQAEVIHPVRSQAGTVAPVQSQSGTMVPMHPQTRTMVPLHSQIRNVAPAYSQVTQSMVPMHSQTGTMIPMHAQAGTMGPIQSQAGFHSFNMQRTFIPQLNTLSHPASNVYPATGTDFSTNLSWSGLTSAASEPNHEWPSVKCEAQPVGVVNMDDQERMKLERKRAKNRVAAQRCQMRKLERIARLEDKAEKLREQNSKLLQTVDALRGHIAQLKKQITAHANKGCRLLLPDVSTAVTPIVSSL